MNSFWALSDRQRALVAVAVLLDGREAADYLAFDPLNSESLKRAAVEISELPPELRMPLVGSILRGSLSRMEKE